MKIIRSWLFVSGDRKRKMAKGRGNVADALILDLEDSVADDRQEIDRTMVRQLLAENPDRIRQQLWVRVNPPDHLFCLEDLSAVMPGASCGRDDDGNPGSLDAGRSRRDVARTYHQSIEFRLVPFRRNTLAWLDPCLVSRN